MEQNALFEEQADTKKSVGKCYVRQGVTRRLLKPGRLEITKGKSTSYLAENDFVGD